MTAKIAVLGCGKQAVKHVAGLRSADPGCGIVLADVVPERARALAGRLGVGWHEEPLAAVADPAVTAISICTPTPSHAPLIRAAIAAGKPFCCEKPLTDDPAEAAALARAADAAGVFGMVGFTFRYAPGMRLVRDLVAAARSAPGHSPLGRPVSALFRIGGRGNHAAWKHQRATGGGAINEMLVHLLDLAFWTFGPAARLETVACRCLQPERTIEGKPAHCDAEDLVVARMVSAEGVEILIHADFVSPAFVQFVEAHGADGSVVASIVPEFASFVYTNAEGRGFARGRTEQAWGAVDFYAAQMAAFLEGVAGGAPEGVARLADSVPVLQAMAAIRAGSGLRALQDAA